MFSPDFREFVELLIAHEVEYLIVGGYAVGVHGRPRFTGDLDIWLNISEANAAKMVRVIKAFGFGSYPITKQDFLTSGRVIQLGYPPLRIDLLTEIDGVTFEACFPNRKIIDLDGLKVNFIGYQDLLANKKASGRLRDLDDLANLS